MPRDDDDNILQFQDPRYQQAWRSRLAMDIDANPDDASRASDISDLTGASSAGVYNNLEDADKQTKVQLGSRIVQANPNMQRWLIENNMAAKLANDDYGNLHPATQAYEDLAQNSSIPWGFQSAPVFGKHLRGSTGTLIRALARETGSSTLAGYGAQLQRSAEDIALTPEQQGGFINSVAATIGDMGPAVLGGVAAGVAVAAAAPGIGAAGIGAGVMALLGGFGTAETMGEEAEKKGVAPEPAYNTGFVLGTIFGLLPIPMTKMMEGPVAGFVSRVAGFGLANTALGQVEQLALTEAKRWTYDPKADFHVPRRDELLTNFFSNVLFGGAFEGTLMYMRAGKPIPMGADPITDYILSERDATFDKATDDLLKKVAKSNLTERGEAGKKALADLLGKYPDATMNFDADAVLKLYGDKPPSADDGLFGFLPDIAQQLKSARDNGTSIRVPLNEFAARQKDINPEAMKGLKTARHLDPMGMSEDVRNTLQQAQAQQQQQQQELLTTPEKEAYYGGLTDSGSKVLDTVRRTNGMDNILPVPPGFWSDFGKGILEQPQRFPLKNVGGTTALMSHQPSTRGQVFDIKSLGDTTGTEILNMMDYSKFPGISRALSTFFRDRAQKLAGDTPVTIISDKDMKRLAPRTPAGYDPNIHHVVIKESVANGSKGDHFLAHVVIHEMAHAASVRQMYEDPHLMGLGVSLMNEFKAWLEAHEPQTLRNPEVAYAFTGKWINHKTGAIEDSGTEFIAQAQSSPDVEDALTRANMSSRLKKALEIPAGKNSFWEGAKHLVRRALEKILKEKVPDNILDGLFGWGDMLQRHHEAAGKTPDLTTPPPPPGEPPQPPEPPMPEPPEMELFKDQKVLGYTKKTWDDIKDKLLAQREKDRQFMRERVLDEARQHATQEWIEGEKVQKVLAADRVLQRPEIAADRFIREGIYNGKRVTIRKFDWNKLTPEQRDALGPAFWSRKGGYDPNEMFSMFGFTSGGEMMSDLMALVHQRKLENLTPNAHFTREVERETARLMRDKYGSPEDMVLDYANDHIHNEGQLDLMHDDTLRIMTKYGQDTSGITRAKFTGATLRDLEDTVLGKLKSEHLSTQNYGIGKRIEAAAVKGDSKEEIKLAQQRERTFIQTGYMRDFEKSQEQVDRILGQHIARNLERFSSKETAAMHNYIQLIGRQLGKRIVPRTDELLAELKEKGYPTLDKLLNDLDSKGIMVDAPNWLRNWDFSQPKPLKDWKIGEANSMFDLVKSLHKEGLAEGKAYINEQNQQMQPLIDGMKESLEKWKAKPTPMTPTQWQQMVHYAQLLDANLRIAERIFNRFDGDNPRGLWNQVFSREYTEAANHDERLRREWRKVWQENKQPKRYRQFLQPPSVLKDPDGTPITGFTGENLYAIALNMGTEDNWFKYTRSHGMSESDAAELEAWVKLTMTLEDWKYVDGIWKFFKKPKNMLDVVYRNIYGNAPGTILPRAVDVEIGGKMYHFDGGYYPLMKDREATGYGSKTATFNVDDGPDNLRQLTANPHARDREEWANYVVSSNMAQLPSRIYQMAHDIAFRQHLVTARKFLSDSGLQNAIKTHYGPEYFKAIEQHYQRMATGGTYNQAAGELGERASEFARRNVLAYYIGANVSTVLKHFWTALSNSIVRVGPEYYLKGNIQIFGRDATTGDRAMKLVNSFEEIQRRDRDIDDRFGLPRRDFTTSTARDYIIHWGAIPVAISDMVSSKPLAYGAFLKAIDEGQNPAEARFEAERAVRFAHGSTAPTNQPGATDIHYIGRWVTSIYHFWGTMLQNRIDMAFRLNDMYKDSMEYMESGGRDFDKLKTIYGMVPVIAADVFAYVIWPAMVEEYVTGLWRDDRRGFGERLGWYVLGGLANSVLYARDIWMSLEQGRDQAGLFTGALKPLHETIRDIAEFEKKGMGAFNNPKFAGNLIRDLIHLGGLKYGLQQVAGNAAKYGYNWSTGVERPRTGIMRDWFHWGDVAMGVTRGEQKQKVFK